MLTHLLTTTRAFVAQLRFKKLIALVLICVIFFNQSFRIDLALGAAKKEEFQLVTILVEKNMWEDIRSYDGLRNEYPVLYERNVKQRIERYALDIQADLPYTKVIIVPVESSTNPSVIANVLENLYFEGQVEKDEKNKLTGVVLIGDLPLPVVNKNGNTFLSLYPYTDFEEKAYIYNPSTNNFESNALSLNPKPEIWHGVITSPVSYLIPDCTTQADNPYACVDPQSYEAIASYLDKNHLYKKNLEGFGEFDSKMLFADTVTEQKLVSKLGYANYMRYIEHIEDRAYSRYTKELATELYTEVNGELMEGDAVDNDGDGRIDEDPINGKDDDGDGLIDEDEGDPENTVDNDDDGQLNEDTRKDNNLDNDTKTDEDGPGDMDDDGCPGECEKDDDRDCKDFDKDGLRSYIENSMFGTESLAYKRKSIPFPPVTAAMVLSGLIPPHNKDYCTDEPPLPTSASCYEPGHFNDPDYFHPEWDDDEDGVCDEDGTSDNDNDGDGVADEDAGEVDAEIVDESMFADLPDIQSKHLIDRYFKKYYELFEKHLGTINVLTDNTGRYSSSVTDASGLSRSEVDSLITLITKKDEFVTTYLRAQNEYLEKQIDAQIAEIQEDIPLIARASLAWTLEFDDDDDPSTPTVTVASPSAIYFVNHSVKSQSAPLIPFIHGERANDITSAEQCSLYLGSYCAPGDTTCEDSKLVEANRVYDPLTSGSYQRDTDDDEETYPDNLEDGDDFGGCFGNNIENREWCFSDNSIAPIKSKKGTLQTSENIPVDYRACFDFKEATNFLGPLVTVPGDWNNYLYYAEHVSDAAWKLEKDGVYPVSNPPHPPLGASGCCGSGPDVKVENENQFEIALDYYKEWLLSIGARDNEYLPLDTIPFFADTVSGQTYYLDDILTKLGYDVTQNSLLSEDFFANGPATRTLENPYPRISEINLVLMREYVSATDGPGGIPVITPTLNQAYTIPSVVTHKEPTNDTIMQQNIAQFTKDLPVDSPRYTTFRGSDLAFHKVIYPDLFAFENVDDFRASLISKDQELASLPSAPTNLTVLQDTIDTKLNRAMMEDAILWRNMTIDEKHHYMLTVLMDGRSDPFISRPKNGYEIAHFIGKGDSTGFDYSFNGGVPENDEDIEWKIAKIDSAEAREEAMLALNSGINEGSRGGAGNLGAGAVDVTDIPTRPVGGFDHNTSAIPLADWMDAMSEWVESLSEDYKFEDPEALCGECALPQVNEEDAVFTGTKNDKAYIPAPREKDSDFDNIPDSVDMEPTSSDGNKNDIPDGSEKTQSLSIISDAKLVKADGKERVTVTVRGMTNSVNGTIVNMYDSFTQVTLTLIEGAEFKALSPLTQPLINGNAEFVFVAPSKESTLKIVATAQQRSEIAATQPLTIAATGHRIKLFTYTLDEVRSEPLLENTTLENIVFKINESKVIGRLKLKENLMLDIDPEYFLEFIPAQKNQSQKAVLRRYDSTSHTATITLPATIFSVQNLHKDLTVEEADTTYIIKKNATEITRIQNGYIYIDPTLATQFNENRLTNILVSDGAGTLLFELNLEFTLNEEQIKNTNSTPKISQKKSSKWEKITQLFAKLFTTANAIGVSPRLQDSDSDTLLNFEEFFLGTDIESYDSDSDSFSDAEEISNGYDPLRKGEQLFIDFNSTHPSFTNVLTLLTRGILRGYEDHTFRPDKILSREEFVKINIGANCIDCTKFANSVREAIMEKYSSSPFPDTNITPELNYCIAHAKNESVITGYLASPYTGYFMPKNSVSRAEAIKVLMESAAQFQNITSLSSPIYASGDKPWYYNHVLKAYEEKILTSPLIPADRSDFKKFFDEQIRVRGEFIRWLELAVTRTEFADMVASLIKTHDCSLNDVDMDGLSDQSEIHQYGTLENDRDTDKGGVMDGDEVLRNIDPLDASDDVTAKPFKESSSKISTDLNTDTDGDGLTDKVELHFGSDKLKADTDTDGMSDNEEYITGGDPNLEDTFKTEPNRTATISGLIIENETVVTEVNDGIFEDVQIARPISQIPVSEETEFIQLEAQVLLPDGNIDHADTTSIVEFYSETPDHALTELARIRVTDGVAKTKILSKQVAGTYTIKAKIIGKNIAGDTTNIAITPLLPTSIHLSTPSSILQAGVTSTKEITLELHDEYGNLSYGSPYMVDVTVSGPAEIVTQDADPKKDGLQLLVLEGKNILQIQSTETAGEIIINASYTTLTTELKLRSEKEIKFDITHSNPDLISDGSSDTEIRIRAVNAEGTLLEGYNETVSISVDDTALGIVTSGDTVLLKNGEGKAIFRTGTLSGTARVMVAQSSVIPSSHEILIKPLSPAFIMLSADSDVLYTDDNESIAITASLYDKNGNFVTHDTDTFIEFDITTATHPYAEFSGEISRHVVKGEAVTQLKSTGLTGPIHIIAQDIEGRLTPGTLELHSKARFDSEDVETMYPHALFASFLGEDMGNFHTPNNLSNTYTHNGKTQASISLLTTPEQHALKGLINSNGKISNIDTSYLYTQPLPANDPKRPTIVAIKDIVTDRNLVEVLYRFDEHNRLYTNIQNPSHLQYGIFLNSLSVSKDYTAVKNSRGLSLHYKNNEVISINANGQINVIDKRFSLHVDESHFAVRFSIMFGGNIVGEIIINQDFKKPVTLLKSDFDITTFAALKEGIYIIPHIGISSLYLEPAANGNSSKNSTGYALRSEDEVLPDEMSPGGNSRSLEHAAEDPTIGFEKDNKLYLHFTSGALLGEALKENPSEIAILYGDPTISLAPKNIASSGFDKTIGDKVFESNDPIKDITPFDYDANGLPDLLVSYKNGDLKLIKNRHSLTRFEPMGDLLNVRNGVQSHAIADFNDDDYSDIAIVGKESCHSDETSCVDIYFNDEGEFKRVNLPLQLKYKASEIRTGDLDNDGDVDIVISDMSGSLIAFYNEGDGFDLFDATRKSEVGSLGVSIDSTKNLKDEILIDYTGQIIDDKKVSTDDNKFARLNQAEYMKLQFDPDFSTSTKIATDVNGETLSPGDKIQYTLSIRNDSAQNYTDVALADLVSDAMTFDPSTVTCDSCDLTIYTTNDITRPFLIRDVAINAGETVNISYLATLNSLPEVHFELLKDASEFGVKKDTYMDIVANVEGNPSGIMTYFYSDFKDSTGIKYSKHQFIPNAENKADTFIKPADNIDRTQDFDTDADEVPEDVKEAFTGLTTNDSDNDGLPNAWDTVSGPISDYTFKKSGATTYLPTPVASLIARAFAVETIESPAGEILDTAAGVIEDVISKLTCGGGCFAIPVNMSFLTPGNYNLFGIPVGFDNGTPVFCWGATNVSTVGAGSMCETSSGGRLYLSPTLNGGLVFALCLGPKAAGQCFAFNIPLLQALGVCDAFNSAIETAMSKASELQASTNGTLGMSLTGQSSGTSSGGSGGMVSFNLGNYSVPSVQNVNTRISGFPSIFTDWIDRQTEELGDILDLPDIYFVYPDPASMLGIFKPADEENTTKPKTLYDALNYLNSLPLIEIETEEIVIKIPAITQVEIEKKQQEAERFLENIRAQVDEYEKLADSFATAPTGLGQSLVTPEAVAFIEEIQELVKAIEKNTLVLEEYAKLPYQIMEYRYGITKYVTQVVCYVDAIINSTAGYVVKNQKRVKDWVKAIQDIVKSVKTWQDLIQLSISYQDSCDKCTTSRLSLTELMMKVFVFIPSPPIVDLPKWPDIVLDISNIQAGVKLYFPELRIEPQPISLPDLPNIQLPKITMNMDPRIFQNISLPEIPVLPEPPQLPNLPNLPGLPIPHLPDVPPPPEFPELPEGLSILVKGLEKVIKILCLVKNGFIPVAEGQLKTKVEELTARSSDIILPVDKGFSIQTPDIVIDLVDRIEIRTKVNLMLDVTPIREGIQALAEGASILTDQIANGITTLTEKAEEKIEEGTDALSDLTETGSAVVEEAVDATSSIPSSLSTPATSFNDISDVNPIFDREVETMKNIIAHLQTEADTFATETKNFSDTITVKGTTTYLSPTDPLMTRSLEDLRSTSIASATDSNDLTRIRSGLLTYAEELQTQNALLADYLEFTPASTRVASLSLPSISHISTLVQSTLSDTSTYNDPIQNAHSSAQKIFSNTVAEKDTWLYGRPSASNEAIENAYSYSSPENPSSAEIAQKGIFIYNKEKNISDKLANYDKESGQGSKMVIEDFDKDGDEDIIYTLGTELYYKQNYTKGKKLEYYKKPPKIVKFSELIPTLPSVNMYTRTSQNMSKVRTSWLSTPGASGYEIEMHNLMTDVLTSPSKSVDRILVVEPQEISTQLSTPTTSIGILTQTKGDIDISSVLETDGEVTVDDTITTENNASTIVTFDGTSSIYVDENTVFTVPDIMSPEITLKTGEITLLEGENAFSRPGTTLSTEDKGKITVHLKNGVRYSLDNSSKGTIPKINTTHTILLNTSGDTTVYTEPRTHLKRGDIQEVAAKSIVHAMEESTVEIHSKMNGISEYKLTPHTYFSLPSTLDKESKIIVKKGELEIIDVSKSMENVTAFAGMYLTPNSKIMTSENGSADVSYKNGDVQPYTISLNERETLTIMETSSGDSVSLELELEKANYYAKIYAIDATGQRGTGSRHVLYSPQTCGDKDAPTANAGSTEKKVAIFKTIDIDLSASTDGDGDIIEYFFDTNLEKDTDKDGDPTNDSDKFSDINDKVDSDHDGNAKNDKSQPILTMGPYKDLEPRYLKAWVRDSAGNLTGQEIKIVVFAPEISLSPLVAKDGIVQGELTPPVPNMPFKIIRERDGLYTTLKNQDGTDTFISDEKGSYSYAAFNFTDVLQIKNEDGDVIGLIDQSTGRMNLTSAIHRLQVYPADILPTRIVLENENKVQLATTYLVSEDHIAVTMDPIETSYDAENLKTFEGTHIRPITTENVEFKKIHGLDPMFPGGVEIISDNKRVGLLSQQGNIYLYDERLSLRLKETQLTTDPYVIELLFSGTPIADIFIQTASEIHLTQADTLIATNDTQQIDSDHDGLSDSFELIHGMNPQVADIYMDNDNDGILNGTEARRKTNPSSDDTDNDGINDAQEILSNTNPLKKDESPFKDLTSEHPLYEKIIEYYSKGILKGYTLDGGYEFRGANLISRAEFTKIILKILCIDPRAESYEAPAMFSDIPYGEKVEWYYPITKESFLRNFITGYQAEKNSDGKTPFKPLNPINYAEAIKIVEEVLSRFETPDGTTVIRDLSTITAEEPWYKPYVNIAVNLSEYLVQPVLTKKVFLLTEEEAKRPDKNLSRFDFTEIASRVLNVYSCYETDSDNDGLFDHLEIGHGTDANNADTDNDGLNDYMEILNDLSPTSPHPDIDNDNVSNQQENDLGTDPFAQDSDFDGSSDGDELNEKTNPLDPNDFLEVISSIVKTEETLEDLESGVYIETVSCTVCPCPIMIQSSADMRNDDILFTAITGDNLDTIHSLSNTVNITKIKK